MLTNTRLTDTEAAITPGAKLEHPRRRHISQDREADLPGWGTVQAHQVCEAHWKSPSGVLGEATLTDVLCFRTLQAVGS